jgi:hypothetical protein
MVRRRKLGDDWLKAQVVWISAEKPFVQVLCSRGLGKSLTAAVKAYTHCDANKKHTVLILAPSLRQSAELFRYCKIVADMCPLAYPIMRETQTQLELSNGSRIVILSGASPDTVRGFRAHLIIADEATRISDEMFGVALPILLQSGSLHALTTPAGRSGWFYQTWIEGKTRKIIAKSPEIERMAEVVARDKKFLSESQYRTEVELAWAGSGSTLFSYASLQKAFTSDRKAMNFSFLQGRSDA